MALSIRLIDPPRYRIQIECSRLKREKEKGAYIFHRDKCLGNPRQIESIDVFYRIFACRIFHRFLFRQFSNAESEKRDEKRMAIRKMKKEAPLSLEKRGL